MIVVISLSTTHHVIYVYERFLLSVRKISKSFSQHNYRETYKKTVTVYYAETACNYFEITERYLAVIIRKLKVTNFMREQPLTNNLLLLKDNIRE